MIQSSNKSNAANTNQNLGMPTKFQIRITNNNHIYVKSIHLRKNSYAEVFFPHSGTLSQQQRATATKPTNGVAPVQQQKVSSSTKY